MKRTTAFLAILLYLGCADPAPHHTDRMRIGARRAPDSLHPYVTTTQMGEVVAARLYPKLFRELPRFQDGVPVLEPMLVAEFAFNAEGTELSLRLKPDLAWSDGVPLTAADVVYTYGVQINPEIAWSGAGRKSRIVSLTAPDASTLHVVFQSPSPFNLLDLNEGFIVPQHFFEPLPPAEWKRAWGEELVVFGPYRPSDVADEERLVLRAMHPDMPDLGLAFVRERETLYRLLIAGDLDYAWPLPVDRLGAFDAAVEPVLYNDMGFAFLGFNPIRPEALADADIHDRDTLVRLAAEAAHPLFGDVRVRRALVLGTNRDAHVAHFWQGHAVVPANPWQTGLEAYQTTHAAERYDAEAAGRLLDEAGWVLDGHVRKKDGRPLTFKVLCNISKGIREQYLLAVQQDLRALGVDMQIELTEALLYQERCLGRQFDAVYGEYRISSRPDRADLLHSSSPFNFCSWYGADDLLAQVRDAPSVPVLYDGVAALEDRFHADLPFMMLFSRTMVAGAAKGTTSHANYLDPLFGVETWSRRP